MIHKKPRTKKRMKFLQPPLGESQQPCAAFPCGRGSLNSQGMAEGIKRSFPLGDRIEDGYRNCLIGPDFQGPGGV
jgi:hypothetical protein